MSDNPKIPDQPKDLKDVGSDQPFDSLATHEEKQLSSGKPPDVIRSEAKAAEARRAERFRNHFENLIVITLYMVWLAIIIVGLIWFYHLIAPPGLPRLPYTQVNTIQSILTASMLTGIASKRLKKRL